MFKNNMICNFIGFSGYKRAKIKPWRALKFSATSSIIYAKMRDHNIFALFLIPQAGLIPRGLPRILNDSHCRIPRPLAVGSFIPGRSCMKKGILRVAVCIGLILFGLLAGVPRPAYSQGGER